MCFEKRVWKTYALLIKLGWMCCKNFCLCFLLQKKEFPRFSTSPDDYDSVTFLLQNFLLACWTVHCIFLGQDRQYWNTAYLVPVKWTCPGTYLGTDPQMSLVFRAFLSLFWVRTATTLLIWFNGLLVVRIFSCRYSWEQSLSSESQNSC